MNRIAIVIGATGVVGKEVVACLSLSTHFDKIITLTRKQVKYSSPKVTNYVVDFNNVTELKKLLHGSHLFSCLGTTKKQAGSIEKQRIVDVNYQLKIAQLAVDNGIDNYLLVSSFGANCKSKNAYSQMKGEVEESVKKLPFKKISIFCPSLLLGKRKDIRVGETVGKYLLPMLCILPILKKYRPIQGKQVAKKMVSVAEQPTHGIETFSLEELFQIDL